MTTADMPTETERRLTRSPDGRIIAGVCQGAGHYFDVDPVIFRIVLAGLTVFGGAGILIYVVAWALMPEAGSRQTRLEQWIAAGRPDVRRILLFAVVAVSVITVLGTTNVFAHRYGAVAVAVLAALLLTEAFGRRHGHGLFPPRRPAAPPVYGPPAAPNAAATLSYPTVVMPPARPRERAWLGWLTFSAVLLAGGVMWLVAGAGAASPQPADALAVCVAIAGIGLVVGTFVGRARAMIPIGVLLALALGLANGLPRDLTWSAGNRDWTPVSADLAPSYVLGVGEADLDLTQLDPATSATIDARIGAGRLFITVPHGMGVVIDAKVTAGRLYVFGHEQSGTGVKSATAVAAKPHNGTLTLHLQGGYGDVEVRDAAA